jgi:hypothetical protein
MSNSPPFSLRIFVADGDPDGLRLVERSNWIGKALMFSRALYTKVRARLEFQQTGAYLLQGPRTDGEGEMLYIGEGDPVGPRLESHYANNGNSTFVAAIFSNLLTATGAGARFLPPRLLQKKGSSSESVGKKGR